MTTDPALSAPPATGLNALHESASAAAHALRDPLGPLSTRAMPRILITGSLIWSVDDVAPAIYHVLSGIATAVPGRLELVHGDAPGADRAAEVVALRLGWSIMRVPITKQDRRAGLKMAPLLRDQRMVDCSEAAMCIGFPHPRSRTRGTWQTMAMAVDAGIATFLATPGMTGLWTWSPYTWGTDDVR